jgi:hypothetical protein
MLGNIETRELAKMEYKIPANAAGISPKKYENMSAVI